jgi:hypothetical protein
MVFVRRAKFVDLDTVGIESDFDGGDDDDDDDDI